MLALFVFPCFHKEGVVLFDNSFDLAQFVRFESACSRFANGAQPEFGFFAVLANVDMRRFIDIGFVEPELESVDA